MSLNGSSFLPPGLKLRGDGRASEPRRYSGQYTSLEARRHEVERWRVLLPAEAVLSRDTDRVQGVVERGKDGGQGEERIIFLVGRERQAGAAGQLVAEAFARAEEKARAFGAADPDACGKADGRLVFLRLIQDSGGDGRAVLRGQIDTQQKHAAGAYRGGVAQQIGPAQFVRRNFEEAGDIADERRLRPRVFCAVGAQQQEQVGGGQCGNHSSEENPALPCRGKREAVRGRQERLVYFDRDGAAWRCEMNFVARPEIGFPLAGIGRQVGGVAGGQQRGNGFGNVRLGQQEVEIAVVSRGDVAVQHVGQDRAFEGQSRDGVAVEEIQQAQEFGGEQEGAADLWGRARHSQGQAGRPVLPNESVRG